MTAIAGLLGFLIYFSTAVGLIIVYLVVYVLATSRHDVALIRQNVLSASLALGMSLIGFALPLSSAVVYAQEARCPRPCSWARPRSRPASSTRPRCAEPPEARFEMPA